jgi:hypothetical protein
MSAAGAASATFSAAGAASATVSGAGAASAAVSGAGAAALADLVGLAREDPAGFSATGFSVDGASTTGAGVAAVSTAGVLGTVIWSVCSSVLMGSRDSWHPVGDVTRARAGEMPYE